MGKKHPHYFGGSTVLAPYKRDYAESESAFMAEKQNEALFKTRIGARKSKKIGPKEIQTALYAKQCGECLFRGKSWPPFPEFLIDVYDGDTKLISEAVKNHRIYKDFVGYTNPVEKKAVKFPEQELTMFAEQCAQRLLENKGWGKFPKSLMNVCGRNERLIADAVKKHRLYNQAVKEKRKRKRRREAEEV